MLPHRKGENTYIVVMVQISVSSYQKVNFGDVPELFSLVTQTDLVNLQACFAH